MVFNLFYRGAGVRDWPSVVAGSARQYALLWDVASLQCGLVSVVVAMLGWARVGP